MLDSLNRNQLYIAISISFVLFIILNFIIGPTSIFTTDVGKRRNGKLTWQIRKQKLI